PPSPAPPSTSSAAKSNSDPPGRFPRLFQRKSTAGRSRTRPRHSPAESTPGAAHRLVGRHNLRRRLPLHLPHPFHHLLQRGLRRRTEVLDRLLQTPRLDSSLDRQGPRLSHDLGLRI